MEINHIPEFIALAEYGSSYTAAEKLFVSQSSLLRHVQAIEDEFGMPLFDRTRKGFLLNKEGQVFLVYAKQILSLKNHCYSALNSEEEDAKVVRLCAEGKIIDLVMDFIKTYPDIRLAYYNADNAEEALFEGEIDVAFLTNLTPRLADNFQMIRYSNEEVLVLLYEDHPLASQERVSMEQLKGEDLIVLTNDLVIDERFFNRIGYGNGNGRGPNIIASVPTGNDLIRMVREKMGITLIHGRSGMIPPAEGLKVLELDPPIQYEMNIYFRKDTPMKKASETFVNYAKRWISTHRDINQSLIE